MCKCSFKNRRLPSQPVQFRQLLMDVNNGVEVGCA
jgi:hypothetical protein